MSASAERRQFIRIPFNATALLRQDDNQWPCKLIDMSLKGLLVQSPDGCKLCTDSLIDVTVTLSDDIDISMTARVAHQSSQQLGMVCDTIDLESMRHLRRLMEHNHGDPEAAGRELSELILVNTEKS